MKKIVFITLIVASVFGLLNAIDVTRPIYIFKHSGEITVLDADEVKYIGFDEGDTPKNQVFHTDNGNISIPISEIDSVILGYHEDYLIPIYQDLCGNDDGHPHFVDLDLPSGLKWSCCNVGAKNPWNRGDYFAWGDTVRDRPYEDFRYQDDDGDYHSGVIHKFGNFSGTENDAATVHMGQHWRTPTYDEMQELYKYCRWVYTIFHGQYGYVGTGRNGRQIFMPFTGIISDLALVSLYQGNYWTSTPSEINDKYAWAFLMKRPTAGEFYLTDANKDYGMAIRPVYVE